MSVTKNLSGTKNLKGFSWIQKYQVVFEKLKYHLAQLLLLFSILDEALSLYLVAIKQVVSLVSMQDDSKVERLIYDISHILSGAKERYPLHREVGFWQGNFASIFKCTSYK